MILDLPSHCHPSVVPERVVVDEIGVASITYVLVLLPERVVVGEIVCSKHYVRPLLAFVSSASR